MFKVLIPFFLQVSIVSDEKSALTFIVSCMGCVIFFYLAAFKIFGFAFGSHKFDYDVSRCGFPRFAELPDEAR